MRKSTLLGRALALICALMRSEVFAAAPVLDHLFPVAVQTSTTNSVTAIGKFDPWPPQIWVDAPGIMFKPETNSGVFRVEVAANAAEGAHLVRAFNEQGASGLRFLVVTSKPQVAEREPNDDYAKPQVVDQLPASINGRLEKAGDVDSFGVTLKAGQTLIASVEAYTLASPVDAVLRVVDARGVQQAWNHDDGTTLDPFLAWTAPTAGSYVVQVFGFGYPADSEVRFAGNAKCVYRLHLSHGPYLRYTRPLGVQRGTNTLLQLIGWNVEQKSLTEIPFDGSRLEAKISRTPLSLPGFDNALLLPVSEGPELTEREPNDSASEAQPLDVPCAVTGCIGRVGDVDRFSFRARKEEKLVVEVEHAALGFPVEARLGIEDAKGGAVVKPDNSAAGSPKLEWVAPEDGLFIAVVDSLLHRCGADHLYRLSIRRAVPAVRVTVPETAFAITPGKTNELKVAVKFLYGFHEKLALHIQGLPDGVTSANRDAPEKGGDVTIQLIASPEAKTFSGPIQIVATEAASKKGVFAAADLTSSTVNNGVPGGFNKLVIESTDLFWLTVLPAQAPKPNAAAAAK